MPEMNMVEAISDALNFEMERDGRVMVLGEDVGRTGGVFRATDGLFDKFGRDRVVDMPLAEGAIVGSSVGLAISGLIPALPLRMDDNVLRLTPRLSAASVTETPSGSRHKSRIISPGCGGLCINIVSPQ